MLFPTQEKAENFIRFNADDIGEEGSTPCRSYFCASCGGWHVTKRKDDGYYRKRDQAMQAVHDDMVRLRTVMTEFNSSYNKKRAAEFQVKLEEGKQCLERLKSKDIFEGWMIKAEKLFARFSVEIPLHLYKCADSEAALALLSLDQTRADIKSALCAFDIDRAVSLGQSLQLMVNDPVLADINPGRLDAYRIVADDFTGERLEVLTAAYRLASRLAQQKDSLSVQEADDLLVQVQLAVRNTERCGVKKSRMLPVNALVGVVQRQLKLRKEAEGYVSPGNVLDDDTVRKGLLEVIELLKAGCPEQAALVFSECSRIVDSMPECADKVLFRASMDKLLQIAGDAW